MAALKCWLQEKLAKEIGLTSSRRRNVAVALWRRQGSGAAATEGCANVLADAESCAPRYQHRYG